jgi:hypothetical protein
MFLSLGLKNNFEIKNLAFLSLFAAFLFLLKAYSCIHINLNFGEEYIKLSLKNFIVIALSSLAFFAHQFHISLPLFCFSELIKISIEALISPSFLIIQIPLFIKISFYLLFYPF